MKKLLKDKIKKYDLSNTVSIVAVSGGVDSVVLLDLLASLLPKENIVIAHVNHGLRQESKDEEAFVKKLAKHHGIIFESIKLKLAKKDEASARKERYNYLNTIKDKYGAKYIITAHHLDDQLETIILNLTRGAGPVDLWGMDELSGDILRPLLRISKKEIKKYAKENSLKFLEDESNANVDYARNRVRHKVIPELEKINPSVKKTVAENSYLARELSAFIDVERAKLEKGARKDNKLSLAELKKSPQYLVKELIKVMLKQYTGSNTDIYKKNIDEVFGLIETKGNKSTSLHGLTIIKDYQYLTFGKVDVANQEGKKLKVGEEIIFNDFEIRVSTGDVEPTADNILLPSSFSDNLKVRVWQKGDKIRTLSGTKKLQDIFVDAKISAADRQKWPVIIHNNEIVWVPKLQGSKHAQSAPSKKGDNNLIIEVR